MTFRERLDQIDEEHKINAALAGIEKETSGEAAEPPVLADTEQGVPLHCSECGANTFREEHNAIMCTNCGHGPFCNYCWNRHIQQFHPLLVKPYEDARRGFRRRAQFLNHYLIRTVVKPAGFGLGLLALLAATYYLYLDRGEDHPAQPPAAHTAPPVAAPEREPTPAPLQTTPLQTAPLPTPPTAANPAPQDAPGEAPQDPPARTAGAGLAAALPLDLLQLTSPVARSAMASLTIQTAAAAHCTIQVRYRSGPSKARGLEPATADSEGKITWSWRVGYRTGVGNWPIEVACESAANKAHRSASVTVTE
jgi:hypothetical protein